MPRDHTENPVAVQAGCRWVAIPGDRGPAAVLRIRRHGAGMARYGPSPTSLTLFSVILGIREFAYSVTRGARRWGLRLHSIRCSRQARARTFRQHGRYETFPRGGSLSEPVEHDCCENNHCRILESIWQPNRGTNGPDEPGIRLESRLHTILIVFQPPITLCLGK
jgi:hypothetical protein